MTTSATDGSDSLSKRAILKFTGIPTANTSVKVPAVSKIYIVHSSLAVSTYNIFIHPTGSSVGVTVGPSDTVIMYCDGTDMLKVATNLETDLVLLKSGNLASLANTSAALVNLGITASASELNVLDGITASTSELNVLDGITATVGELNILDGVLVCAAEINYLNDVTSSIQAQLSTRPTLASIGTAFGFSTYFQSSETTIAAGTYVSVSHLLSAIPKLFMPELVCKVTDAGYAVGDRIPLYHLFQFDNNPFHTFYTTAAVGVTFGSSSTYRILNKTTGSSTTITASSWKVVLRAWA